MKQVHLKLFFCLLLATTTTGQMDTASMLGPGFGDQQFGMRQTGVSQQLIADEDRSSSLTFGAPRSAPNAVGSDGTGYGSRSYLSQPDNSYGGGSYGGSSYGKNKNSGYGRSSYGGDGGSYGGSYGAESTGQPYGIQSTGEYTTYYPEKLDLSRCGPPPTDNPCTPYGPEYYPLPGYPHCYIECAFERLFVKPCPANLVWNARMNVCDWPTVASYPAVSDNYGTTSYGNSVKNYGSSSYDTTSAKNGGSSSDSYGRKKLYTTERKKRSGYGGSSYGKNKNSGYGGSSYGDSGNYGGSSDGKNENSGYGRSSYGGDGGSYGGSYGAEATGQPYGIQSTGEYKTYYPEKLDLSRCGPPPTDNPCTPYGPEYYPLPGYPHCYIQCAFERLFVKPCPANSVWNARIHVCDWRTVASYPAGSDNYGTTSYGNSGNNYGSSSYDATSANNGGGGYGSL